MAWLRHAVQEVVKCSDDAAFLEACVEAGVVAGVANSLLCKTDGVRAAATKTMLCLIRCAPPLCYIAQR